MPTHPSHQIISMSISFHDLLTHWQLPLWGEQMLRSWMKPWLFNRNDYLDAPRELWMIELMVIYKYLAVSAGRGKPTEQIPLYLYGLMFFILTFLTKWDVYVYAFVRGTDSTVQAKIHLEFFLRHGVFQRVNIYPHITFKLNFTLKE